VARGDESKGALSCLRCAGGPLNPVGDAHTEVAFFECARCGRQYALGAGKDLTFRWGHPISRALYPVMFSTSPQAEAGRAVDATLRARTPNERAAIIAEIRLELDHPTQRVTDILDCRAGEDDLREFLREYCQLGEGFD